jgi:uncharacterized membrane protein YqiK
MMIRFNIARRLRLNLPVPFSFRFCHQSLPVSATLATILTSGAIVAMSPGVVSANSVSLATTRLIATNSAVDWPMAAAAVAQGRAMTPASTVVSVPPGVPTAQIWPGLPSWLVVVGGVVIVVMALPQIGWIAGLIVIGEREVGIITKKFAAKSLPAGQLIALNGEAGWQADTLPPGWHFGYFPWQYNVKKDTLVVIPQGEIGLIVANDGNTIPPERILGKTIDCDDFQNARAFLSQGGEKGRQLAILTAGTYRINTALFEIITRANAPKHGMNPELLQVRSLEPNKVGIVTALDGLPIAEGEIAGPMIPHHENFQKAQLFMNGGGRRGLQEQVVLSGSWNLNPWFAAIQPVAMTEVPIGYVGVVISFVGQSHEDVSGDSFTHGNLVNKGDKGVWIEPLYPGKHPLNTQIMKMELVPTTNIRVLQE